MTAFRITKFAVLVLAATGSTVNAQQVLLGPIMNPANQHRYYILSPATWDAAEARAASMGGHLATINDAAEDTFVLGLLRQSQPNYGRGFIGLVDASHTGTFEWISGESSDYTNWDLGEPNAIGIETVVEIVTGNGRWNNTLSTAVNRSSVVEVEGPVRVPDETPSIQAAINASADGGTILIDPGTYNGCLSIQGKRLTLRATPRAGGRIIDGGNACRLMNIGAGGANGTVIEGLTFRRGSSGEGAGLEIAANNVRVSRCVFTQNTASGVGGAILAEGNNATFVDCLFHHNTAGGGAGLAAYNQTLTLINCTFADNSASIGRDVFVGAGAISAQNSLFWSTGAVAGTMTFDHCILRTSQPGTGYTTADPLLSATYVPSPGSPCIDNGKDAFHANAGAGAVVDAANEGRYVRHGISSDIIDIGALEFQSSPPLLLGDLNGDGVVNALDIQPLVALLLTP